MTGPLDVGESTFLVYKMAWVAQAMEYLEKKAWKLDGMEKQSEGWGGQD